MTAYLTILILREIKVQHFTALSLNLNFTTGLRWNYCHGFISRGFSNGGYAEGRGDQDYVQCQEQGQLVRTHLEITLQAALFFFFSISAWSRQVTILHTTVL